MKRYGVLFSLIMVGSMIAQGDENEEDNFLRRSASLDISPRRESVMVPGESGVVHVGYFPGTFAIRVALKKKWKAEVKVSSAFLDEQETQGETHALFELGESFFDE